MDRLQRQRTAATLVHQAVEAQTQDHMDHTFAGVMFAVRSGQKLPYEYLEISTVWVRGGLGPISVWSTNGVRQTLQQRAPVDPGRAALSTTRFCIASASAGGKNLFPSCVPAPPSPWLALSDANTARVRMAMPAGGRAAGRQWGLQH